jgi:hypothetical protein
LKNTGHGKRVTSQLPSRHNNPIIGKRSSQVLSRANARTVGKRVTGKMAVENKAVEKLVKQNGGNLIKTKVSKRKEKQPNNLQKEMMILPSCLALQS